MSTLPIDRLLGRSKTPRHFHGADGLSVAIVFSRSPHKLDELFAAMNKSFLAKNNNVNFNTNDEARFFEIMNEIYVDHPIHFGSNSHWASINERRSTPVPSAVTRVFRSNPEAARALLEEMAHWANQGTKTLKGTRMEDYAVLKLVEKMRASPEKVMQFIGACYNAGEYHSAAIALQHAQELALQTAKRIAEIAK